MKFLKKLLKNEQDNIQTDRKMIYEAICILYEFARIDGVIDERELNQIRSYLLKFPDETISEEKLKELFNEAETESSLYPFIEKLNTNYTKQQKIELITQVWSLIISDEDKDAHEVQMFFNIGDLLGIKRTELNKIKNT